MELKDLIKNGKEEFYEKKKPNKIITIIIIMAALILVVLNFFEKPVEERKNYDQSTVANTNEYIKQQEQRLEMILEKINGAGKVAVYITTEAGGEKIPAKDVKTKISKDGVIKNDDKSNSSYQNDKESDLNDKSDKYNKYTEENESTVVSGSKSSGEPYIVKEKTPEISGVLVVATGAASEKVRLEIYDAVKAVYGIAAHRIKVCY